MTFAAASVLRLGRQRQRRHDYSGECRHDADGKRLQSVSYPGKTGGGLLREQSSDPTDTHSLICKKLQNYKKLFSLSLPK